MLYIPERYSRLYLDTIFEQCIDSIRESQPLSRERVYYIAKGICILYMNIKHNAAYSTPQELLTIYDRIHRTYLQIHTWHLIYYQLYLQ
jgi:hypothetical protein